MRHLTNESTSTGRLPWVRKRSGSASSKVRMRMSNRRTFCSSGHLKCSPERTTISFTSPSWNTIAFWRWSTVNRALDTTSASTASTATTGPRALMGDSLRPASALAPLAVAQRLAGARRVGRRLRRGARRRRLGARRARVLHDLVERQVEQVPAAAVVHHDLAGRGEHRLHGLDVDALARHRRRLGVLGEHLLEARGVALGVGDHALAVALRLLAEPRRSAARARDDVVGVGLALVFLPLAVLAGLD